VELSEKYICQVIAFLAKGSYNAKCRTLQLYPFMLTWGARRCWQGLICCRNIGNRNGLQPRCLPKNSSVRLGEAA
jgi:hypothetical protein